MTWLNDWRTALGSDKGSNATLIGVVVAVCGNVLISFALNCQKLAHRKIEAAYRSEHGLDNDDATEPTMPTYQAVAATTPVDLLATTQRSQTLPIASPRSRSPVVLSQQAIPLIVSSSPVESIGSRPSLTPRSRTQSTIFNHATIDEVHEGSSGSTSRAEPASDDLEAGTDLNSEPKDGPEESAYLHSKLWWFGFALMNVGEVGNFMSYGFAPASLVAPLGAVALISNCLFAPLILHERFRKQDLLGIALSILGAMTVVYASQSSSARLDPDALVYAITRIPFLIWAAINVAAIIALAGLSSQRTKLENSGWMQGDRWALVDVGLCALFGGFTVLATKAVSSLLSTEWANVFTEWIFYPSILILGLTGIGQIKHLNRALHFHESRVVIPTQFVLFNLTAIVGSAILYRDFDKIDFHRFLTFFYGCCTTFLGVYLLTRPSNPPTPAPTPQASRTPSQTTPLLHKSSTPRTRPSSVAAKHRTITRRGSNSSLNVVGLSPGPYLLLATPSGSPGVVAVPVKDTPERNGRSRSRSTVRGQTR
ncbi:NIPA-like protein 2 OS=Homo sapiens GN=NIPAL2 PE=2 SV=1 [Rhizoctonia solani AG-1 IB]|uniref:NIPA-like protein 2 n=1 Tax=Thanatephorus cucumeris (strain AG1-IB / isolate 7/3/14) TaxID=1108050 RepID=A0A0B7G5I1_THACB|nr:NIPA-like protein 2 OS=Homo sapiens GN=NIPAL2 PE=2 SV=1 [Rhizoctonia solani AG-1 IB]